MIDRRLLAGLFILVLAACQSGYQTTQNRQQSSVKPAQKPVQSAPKTDEAGSVTVQAGDTVFGIAFRAGLNYRDVAAWNGIEEPYTIQVGQKLRLTPPSAMTAAKAPQTVTALPNQKTVLSKTVPVGEPVPVKPATPVLSNIVWQWPAKGEIIGVRRTADHQTQQRVDLCLRA